MMCDECGIRPANIRLTTIINGEKRERNLCSGCLVKNRKIRNDFSSLSGHLSSLLDVLNPSAVRSEEPVPDIECPRCGVTYEQFRKEGIVGCSKCYEAFREPLQKMLNSIHGHSQHIGKIPGGADKKMSIKLKIEKLRREQARAILDEAYETAAELRDQIHEFETQLRQEEEANG